MREASGLSKSAPRFRRVRAPLPTALAAALTALGLAGCTGASYSPSGASNTTVAAETNGTIEVSDVKPFGNILVTTSGYTLYLLSSDPHGASSCIGSCAIVWPPLEVSGKLMAGPGLQPKSLSSFQRTGGAQQVLYDHHALYTYEQDTAPGMATGEGVQTYGGIWWVVSPDGRAIKN